MLTEAPDGLTINEEAELETNGGVVHSAFDMIAEDPTTADADPLSFQYPTGGVPLTSDV